QRTLVDTSLERPTSLALHPEAGLMYWTDAGISPKIEFSWMDGTHRRLLTEDKLGYPSGITIDVLGQGRIYWADTKLNLIESCKSDGSDRLVIVSGELFHPFSLDVFEDQ